MMRQTTWQFRWTKKMGASTLELDLILEVVVGGVSTVRQSSEVSEVSEVNEEEEEVGVDHGVEEKA